MSYVALFKDGAQCNPSLLLPVDFSIDFSSCLAPRGDLDGNFGKDDRRSEVIDEKLRLSVPSTQMWKEWGVPDNVKV